MDDAEGVTQQTTSSATPSPAPSGTSGTGEWSAFTEAPLAWICILDCLVQRPTAWHSEYPPPIGSAVRNSPNKDVLQAVFLPSYLEDSENFSIYEEFKVLGKNIRLEVAAVVPPQLATAYGGRRWLDEWTPPPRNRGIINKHRLTLLDAVLVELRAIH